jgi:hypothetical protein
LKLFALKRACSFLAVNADDVTAIVLYKGGKRQRRDICYGSSFLSQSARYLTVDSGMSSMEITNSRGKSRTVKLK